MLWELACKCMLDRISVQDEFGTQLTGRWRYALIQLWLQQEVKCNSVLLCSLPFISWVTQSLWLSAHDGCMSKGPHACCCAEVRTADWRCAVVRSGGEVEVVTKLRLLSCLLYLRLNSWMATWEASKQTGLFDTWWLWVTWFAKWRFQVSEWAKTIQKEIFFLKHIDNIFSLIYSLNKKLQQPQERSTTTRKNKNKGPLVVQFQKDKMKSRRIVFALDIENEIYAKDQRGGKKKNRCLPFCVQISASFSRGEVSCRRGGSAGREEP